VSLLPIRPRSRGARRSLRTFLVVTLHPRFPFNVSPVRRSTDRSLHAPSLACLCKVDKSSDAPLKIAPLPHMFVVRDLVVDMANFYAQYKSIEPYLQTADGSEVLKGTEYHQSKEDRAKVRLVPIRPRWRGERRSLRTFLPGVSLRPHLAGFNPDTPPSTPFNSASDAFELHPDIIARMERP